MVRTDNYFHKILQILKDILKHRTVYYNTPENIIQKNKKACHKYMITVILCRDLPEAQAKGTLIGVLGGQH